MEDIFCVCFDPFAILIIEGHFRSLRDVFPQFFFHKFLVKPQIVVDRAIFLVRGTSTESFPVFETLNFCFTFWLQDHDSRRSAIFEVSCHSESRVGVSRYSIAVSCIDWETTIVIDLACVIIFAPTFFCFIVAKHLMASIWFESSTSSLQIHWSVLIVEPPIQFTVHLALKVGILNFYAYRWYDVNIFLRLDLFKVIQLLFKCVLCCKLKLQNFKLICTVVVYCTNDR